MKAFLVTSCCVLQLCFLSLVKMKEEYLEQRYCTVEMLAGKLVGVVVGYWPVAARRILSLRMMD